MTTPTRRMSEQTGWQSIESAPKDGTYVLLVNTRTRILPHWIGAFRHGLEGEPWEPTPQWRDYGGRYSTPTHWMPLPAPPEATR